MEKSDCSTETPVTHQAFLHLPDFQQEGGDFSGGQSQPAEQGAFSSWDLPLPRICRKAGLCSEICQLWEARWTLYYKPEKGQTKQTCNELEQRPGSGKKT